MKIRPLSELLDDYYFYKKLEFLKDFENCKGACSKIFIMINKYNHSYILCKRITEYNFSQNEYLNPIKINTDRVTKILGVYKNENYYYVTMPFDKKMELFQYICSKKFTEDVLKPFVIEMSKCIKDCHDNNIMHLDVKSENFIIENIDPLKLRLIDFSFSRDSENNKLSRLVGTINYCAPEIYKLKCYKSSDIWSLGILIFFLMDPFQRNIQDLIKTESIETLFINCKFSEELKDLLRSMLQKSPDKRLTIDEVLNSKWLKNNTT